MCPLALSPSRIKAEREEPALVDKDIMPLLALNAMSCNMKKYTQTAVMDDKDVNGRALVAMLNGYEMPTCIGALSSN